MMTLEEVEEAFDDDSGEDYLKFERVKKPRHPCPDICAMLMLDDLFPQAEPGERILSGAGHDIVYLAIDMEKFAEKATPELIKDLKRCGVHYDSESNSLAMFS